MTLKISRSQVFTQPNPWPTLVALTTFICVSFKQSSPLQRWSSVNGRRQHIVHTHTHTHTHTIFGMSTYRVQDVLSTLVSADLSTAADPSRGGDLVVRARKKKTVCCGPRSFAVAEPAKWNSLPASLRNDQLSVASFRRLLKTELFSRTYDRPLSTLVVVFYCIRVGEHKFNNNCYYHHY